jgi:hypothetical protein
MSPEWFPFSRHQPQKTQQVFFLEQVSAADIRTWRAIKDSFLKLHWDFYSCLAYQRSKITDEIRKSLLEASQKRFVFKKWQRVVRFKFSTEPLSLAGSLVEPGGGRFNIGDINPAQFPPFPALYIASDKETALQEKLCQKIDSKNKQEAFDLALTDPTSLTNVSISGQLDTIIDLNKPHKLQNFVDLIKDFTISDHVKAQAKKLQLKEEPDLIKTVLQLQKALLCPNWRVGPMQYDIPAPSQIFAQMVVSAGIEGILYKSKFSNRNCLVIFPQNFDETNGSFIKLDDAAPKETKILKWDAASWRRYGCLYTS